MNDDPRPVKTSSGDLILDRTNPFMRDCEACGTHDDCRPYGVGGQWVCFNCAMKDEAEASRQFEKLMNNPRETS